MSAVLRDNTTDARNAPAQPPIDIAAIEAYIQHARAEADRWERILHIIVGNTPAPKSSKSNGTKPKPKATMTKVTKVRNLETPDNHADRVEAILTVAKRPMDLDRLVQRIKSQYGVDVARKDLANIINRWVNCENPRFTRPAPNTFALVT